MFFRKQRKDPVIPGGGGMARSASPAAAPSVIGRNTRFRGEVRGRGPLVVRGQIHGTIGIEDRLIVTESGRLDAEVRVTEMTIAGEAGGSLRTRGTLLIRATATVTGRIWAGRLRVEEGGVLQGTIARGDADS
jgi:cytoskeletal protein CcmA (bactofilin family)